MFDTSYCTYCGNKLEHVSDVTQVTEEGEVPVLGRNVWLMHRWCCAEFAQQTEPRAWRFTDFPAARRAVGGGV